MMAPDASYPKMIADFFFGKVGDKIPSKVLPSGRINLKALDRDIPSIIWFGHSSYLLTLNGKFILVDPVFSERASPFQFLGSKAFTLANPYSMDDLPDPDVVIITHDHYDHLDYHTILQLRARTGVFCTSLGVGSHLEFWGIDSKKIWEFDWWETETVAPGLELTAAPARHFSGRGLTRFKTLWSSFIIKSGGKTLFLGGDSGYDESFGKIRDFAGPIDFAILECGQYDLQWPFIHMLPEQTVQASVDLKAKAMLAVHWAKFKLANHSWTDSIERTLKCASERSVRVATPQMGQQMMLDDFIFDSPWWR